MENAPPTQNEGRAPSPLRQKYLYDGHLGKYVASYRTLRRTGCISHDYNPVVLVAMLRANNAAREDLTKMS